MPLLLRYWPLLASAVALACAWFIVRLAMHGRSPRVLMESLLAGYLGALAHIVFVLPGTAASAEATSIWSAINMVPLHTVFGIIREHPGMITWQLLGNLLLFVPLGLLLPALGQRFHRFSATVLAGFAVSLGIELVQLALLVTLTAHRSVDVDDVILNVAGVCVGYLIWRGARHGEDTPEGNGHAT